MICFLVAALGVSAYQFACYGFGETLPGGTTTCNSLYCPACLSDSGYTTLPSNCADWDMFCHNVSHPPNPTAVNTSICNCSAINARLQALEMKVWKLENSQATQEKEITSLQSLAGEIQTSLSSLLTTITSILGRLTALEAGTPGPTPGCTESWTCSGWGTCQVGGTQARSCTDAHNCGTVALRPAQIQSCVYSAKEVKFRTNAVSGNYLSTSAEIVFDYNNDGTLDCFKYYSFYSTYTSNLPVVLVKTPEGYNVEKYVPNQVIIRYGKNPYYLLSSGCTTPAGKAPVEPYASNGQELYK